MFDKDEQDFSQILETGLEAILSGEATIEQVLAANPDLAESLRPELESALWLFSSSKEFAPRPGFLPASRKRVLERIKNEAATTGAKHAFMGFAWPKRISMQWVAALVILVMVFSGAGGLVSFSQNALPGEPLYSVKTTSEQVALGLTFNSLKQIQLSDQLANRRLAEVAALIQNGDNDLVEPTIKAYEAQVKQTVALLQNSSSISAHEKKAVATALQANLDKHAGEIAQLAASAPAAFTDDLTSAVNITLLSSSMAGDVADNTFDPTWTPVVTLTPLPSSTPEPSSTPRPTETSVPATPVVETPQGSGDNTLGDATPEPKNSVTATPTPKPSSTPGVGKPATNTPRPTNVHKPTQKPDPPKPEKPTSKPTKIEKATKVKGK